MHMKKLYVRLLRTGVIVWTTIAIIAVLFSRIEDEPILNSLYWTIVTVSTVGYGDVSPDTYTGKFVAICAIGVGLVVYAYMYTILGGMFVEKQITKKFGGENCNYKNHIIICGNRAFRMVCLSIQSVEWGAIL